MNGSCCYIYFVNFEIKNVNLSGIDQTPRCWRVVHIVRELDKIAGIEQVSLGTPLCCLR